MNLTRRARNALASLSLMVFATGPTAGCADLDGADPAAGTAVQEINGGVADYTRFRVGRLDFSYAIPRPGSTDRLHHFCTAAVVAPRIVLTARHCVPTGLSGSLHDVSFETDNVSAGPTEVPLIRRAAVRFAALFSEVNTIPREDDLALVQLAEPLDPRTFAPYVISRRSPGAGENVTFVGYGSNNARPALVGSRQSVTFPWAPTILLANHGDSGGPILRDSGELGRVISGADRGYDVWADPTNHFAELQRIARDWETAADARYFTDVPPTHPFYREIQLVYSAAITLGCAREGSTVRYCPDDPITKAQMAAFIGRATHAVGYPQPVATGRVFVDVPATGLDFAAGWIEQLYREGIVTGVVDVYGQRRYEPNLAVTRAVMTVYLVRVRHGGGFVPPPVTVSSFADVPADAWYARWVEQAYRDGVALGAVGADGLRRFAPERTLTRAEMAAFLSRLFDLPFRRFAF